MTDDFIGMATQLTAKKEAVLKERLLILMPDGFTDLDVANRVRCIIDHDKIEHYTLDDKPFLRVHPLGMELDTKDGYRLTIDQKYEVIE